MEVPDSTLGRIADRPRTRIAAWLRRGFLALLLLLIIAALAGFLGTRTATTSATSDGYTLSLQYARISRPGLNVPWQLTVTHPGGFSGSVVVEVSSAYFNVVAAQNVTPQPSQETQDGTWWRMTFDQPPGDTFVVSMDASVQPQSERGRSGTVRLLSSGTPVAGLHFKTALLP